MHSSLRFDSISWPYDGHECPSYTGTLPAGNARAMSLQILTLTKNVSCVTSFSNSGDNSVLADQSSNATRSSLLQRAAQRDAQAWRELVDLYGPLVAHWCRRCQLDSHSAADCVQDVFASVAVALEQFQPKQSSGSFRAWLWMASLQVKWHRN